MTQSQKDNLRFLTNPVQRIGDLSVKEGVTYQLLPKSKLEKLFADQFLEFAPQAEKD